jgi:hypothetical protein
MISFVAISATLLAPRCAHAQVVTEKASTAMGDYIRAEAKYVRAQGLFLESAATARKINAEAAAIEIDNSVAYVKAYWKRKSVWEEEWRKRHPTMIEQEKKTQEVWRDRIKNLPESILKSDVTDQLNWLFREMSGPALAVEYLSPGNPLSDPRLNAALTETDINQIWLTDGGRGSKLVFRLAEPRILETRWPPALRAPEFKPAREEFEAAREAMLKEIQQNKGPLSDEGGKRLVKTTDQLLTALNDAYPSQRRASPAEFLDYNDAKRFLKTLLLGVVRTIKTDDRSLFQSDHRFRGKSLLELVQYMYQNGLLFAKNPEGGEGVYGKLFLRMRGLYMTLVPDRLADGPEKREPAAEKNGQF